MSLIAPALNTLDEVRETLAKVNAFLEESAVEHSRTLGVLRANAHQVGGAALAHERAMSQVEYAAIIVGGAFLGFLIGMALRKRRA